MKATIVDLRYRMKEVLRALKRKESVHILYHGQEAGVIIPAKSSARSKASKHAFFGCADPSKKKESVEAMMIKLRGSRYAL